MESLKISISRDGSDSCKSAATWTTPYPPHGQGIFTFNILRKTPFELRVCPDYTSSSTPQQWLSLNIVRNKACFKLVGEEERLLAEISGEGVGYNPNEVTSYWFSLDSSNLVLKYGKGYFMEETTILSFNFLAGLNDCEQVKKRSELRSIFGPQVLKFLEFHDIKDLKCYALENCHEQIPSETAHSIVPVDPRNQLLPLSIDNKTWLQLASNLIDIRNNVEFYPQPLIANWPFAVKDSSEVSLFELDSNNYILSGSLPPECKELYRNIYSARIDLDWVPLHQTNRLSDAIRYSFETEGKILYNKLKSKKMKYIRVTVGPSRSTSPGIPYVVELWPKNMGSPIHCHGNSYGVIKVLHGGLRVEIYNRDMKTLIKHFNIQKGNITWMSPHWYQSHRLFNDTADFSATIQCYRYGLSDTKQWPYFDYVNEDGSRGEFLPNSDFTFTELYEKVTGEYSQNN